ncbi:MAG: Gfo/Idh/MocA family oxidoreductase [Lachnospiraceae bacterium]|nr:Gfo/Idh/MocA family oxidoreductase [Lachnospiraceae bacterium]
MKVGVAGAGLIVPTFLRAAALVETMEVQALFARKDQVRADICENFNVPVGYDTYEKLLADPDLDVIYVALPNNLHFSFAREALEAGKHVILEKPFTVTYEEAARLAALAREKKRYLFEAITNLYNPNFAKIQELLPKLGDIKIVEMNYSQYSSRYDAFQQGIICPVFDPAKAGGALMDLNVYNIHLATELFGRPKSVHYYANMERQVDTSGILILEYPDFPCVCIAAKDCGAPCCINIQGNKGCIHSSSMPNELKEFSFIENKCQPKTYQLADSSERLFYELATFAALYERKDEAAFEKRLCHSLLVMEVLDQARRV